MFKVEEIGTGWIVYWEGGDFDWREDSVTAIQRRGLFRTEWEAKSLAHALNMLPAYQTLMA